MGNAEQNALVWRDVNVRHVRSLVASSEFRVLKLGTDSVLESGVDSVLDSVFWFFCGFDEKRVG